MKYSSQVAWFFWAIALFVGIPLCGVIGLGGTFVAWFSCATGVIVSRKLKNGES